MREVSKTDYAIKDIDVSISEITDGIYRISGFVNIYGITFNQFLIDDEKPMLIHTGPIGMYKKMKKKYKKSFLYKNWPMYLFCILKVMNGEEWNC